MKLNAQPCHETTVQRPHLHRLVPKEVNLVKVLGFQIPQAKRLVPALHPFHKGWIKRVN
jgi:hypothetical protein